MTAIDVHTHVVPAALPGGGARDAQWPSIERAGDKAAVMIQGKVFRQIDHRSWDVARRLADMAADGVDVQVLSPMPELLSHWLPAADAADLATAMNETIAAMIAQAPRSFHGLGMVAMQDPERAAKQVGEVAKLGLRGIEIGTHINGIPLGDRRLDPVYAALEAHGMGLFVHPLHPTGMDRIGGPRELAAIVAFPLETAYAAASLMAGGVPARFPKLRILLSHGGGALSWILPRMSFGVGVSPAIGGLFAEPPAETARRFWYDTILYEPRSVRFLAEQVGAGRIVAGSDYPFLVAQPRPVEFARHALPDVDFAASTLAFLGVPAAKAA